jgi:hypothetical protein
VNSIVRVGVRASLDDGPSIFRTGVVVVSYDKAGREVARSYGADPEGLQLALVQYAELDDGRRVTTDGHAELRLIVGPESTREHVHDEVRAFILEEELEDEDDDLESAWEPLVEALAAVGIAVAADAIEKLPFAVELDDEALAALAPASSTDELDTGPPG